MDVKDKVAVLSGGAQGIGRDIVVAGFAEERFMTSTHPWVLERLAIKALTTASRSESCAPTVRQRL